MISREINILCVGQLMSGKSTFLQYYTQSPPTDQHYKIFLKQTNVNHSPTNIYLYEHQEKEGVSVYLKYPYDGILFFVSIDSFHNTYNNIVQQLASYSQQSGNNIFQIPIRLLALKNKHGDDYDDISYMQKTKLIQEVKGLLDEHQVIFIQPNQQYIKDLHSYFDNVLMENQRGIKQSLYNGFLFQGIYNFLVFDYFKLQFKKRYQLIKFSEFPSFFNRNLHKKKT